jgi:hypothetical protein
MQIFVFFTHKPHHGCEVWFNSLIVFLVTENQASEFPFRYFFCEFSPIHEAPGLVDCLATDKIFAHSFVN